MPLEQHNANLRAVIEQNRRTLDRMRQLLVSLERSLSSHPAGSHRSRTITDGAEAIAYLKGEGVYHDRARFPEPMLLFLDLKMPSVDGFHVLEWVKRHRQHATFPIIVMTADTQQKQLGRAYQLGAKSSLHKPFTEEDIRATLAEANIAVPA